MEKIEKIAVTIEEFSAMYGLNAATVSTMVTRNPSALPAVLRVGRSIRFPIKEVDEWHKNQLAKDK